MSNANGIDALIADACRRMVQSANLRLQSTCDQIEAQIRDDIADLSDVERDQYRAESRDLMRKNGVVFDQDDLRERGERFDGGAL